MDYFEQSMHWLLAGSKGSANRLRIIEILKEKPVNLNELTKKVNLNYKTVQHHVDLLVENNFLVKVGSRYGQVYFMSDQLHAKHDLFKKLLDGSKLGGDE